MVGVGSYKPRQSTNTVLYKLVNDNHTEFFNSNKLPQFVPREFAKYLNCGCYENGLTPVECLDRHCSDKSYVPTSCKTRGICPSCSARRMNVSSINLTEKVIPKVPVRQWVLTVPVPLRIAMTSDHKLTLAINREAQKILRAFYRKIARRQGIRNGITGSVTFIQRFNSALQCSIHFHIIHLDGVFIDSFDSQKTPAFSPAPELSDEDVLDLLEKICDRITSKLLRTAHLENLSPTDFDHEESDLFSVIKSASTQGLIALGIRSGQKVRRVGGGQFGYGGPSSEIISDRCVRYGGFTLHANTRVSARNRSRLATLIRYVSRPAISMDRLSITDNGEVKYKLKTPWSNGRTACIFSPEEFMEKLAALIPYPQKNLIIYSGCFAPNHKHRSKVVPFSPSPKRKSRYISLAELHKRNWPEDIYKCRICNGPTRIGKFISNPEEIRKIMIEAGLSARPPPSSEPKLEIYDEYF